MEYRSELTRPWDRCRIGRTYWKPVQRKQALRPSPWNWAPQSWRWKGIRSAIRKVRVLPLKPKIWTEVAQPETRMWRGEEAEEGGRRSTATAPYCCSGGQKGRSLGRSGRRDSRGGRGPPATQPTSSCVLGTRKASASLTGAVTEIEERKIHVIEKSGWMIHRKKKIVPKKKSTTFSTNQFSSSTN